MRIYRAKAQSGKASVLSHTTQRITSGPNFLPYVVESPCEQAGPETSLISNRGKNKVSEAPVGAVVHRRELDLAPLRRGLVSKVVIFVFGSVRCS